MQLFDVSHYETPLLSPKEFKHAKHDVGVFLTAYKSCCERVGLRSFSLSLVESYPIPIYPANEQLFHSVRHQKDVQQFMKLDELYVKALCGITHPFSPEITIRRRKVFLLKYGLGLSNMAIGDRVGYQQNSVIEDSKVSLTQFADALNLL